MTDKRQKILEAARARFMHYGINKTTMQEIAADAGLAVGTLYLYFKNKDDLVVGCAEDFAAQHRAFADQIVASPAPADEKLREYVLARYRAAEELRASSRHAADLARAVLRLRPERVVDEGHIMWNVVTAMLQQGCDAGLWSIPDAAHDAEVFMYSIAYFYPNATMQLVVPPTEEALLKVVDWYLAAWRATNRSQRHASV
jgi:AcrR family transcriptional regulator